MSKADFIVHVAEAGGMSNAEAKRVIDLVFGEIENGLRRAREDGAYMIGGFGTFSISVRAARAGRHPRTGEKIDIRESRSLRFRPSVRLKQAAGC